MRDILFRGKRKQDGEWVEGSLIHCDLSDGRSYTCILESDESKVHPMDFPYLCCESGCIDGYANPVNLETVGQYTGLTIGETRLFEHDIVSVWDCGKEIYRFVVEFGICGGVQNVDHLVGYTGFHFVPADRKTQRCVELGVRNDLLYWLNAYECKIIGNIHDNPELLED